MKRMLERRVTYRSRAAIGAQALLAALAVIAPPAIAQQQTVSFDIESQALASALLAFGRQAGLSVLAPSELVGGRTAPAVRGYISPAVALDQLLQGSGLSYRFVQDNAVRIIAAEAAARSPETLAPVGSSPDDTVIITGTHIRGVHPSSSPVEVYTAEEIERSGATTTEQFVSRMPQNVGKMPQYAAGTSTSRRNYDGVSSADLRGLGLGTTLTLVNGHRMAMSNAGQSADLSLIPVAAIERVEVLTDGASAIYGSDAIGGVINFILRRDFEGAEARLAQGGVTSGGMKQGDVSFAAGTRWGGGQGLASYSFHAASPLNREERDYSAAVGPGTLTPVDTRQSLFATTTQDFGDKLTVSLDLAGGERRIKNRSTYLQGSVTSQSRSNYGSRTRNISGALKADYRINDDLTAVADVAYSEVDVDGALDVFFYNARPQRRLVSDFSTHHTSLEYSAKLDGAAFALPGGAARFSIGVGQREESYSGQNFLSGLQSPNTLGRDSPYAFAELFLPVISAGQGVTLVQQLEVSLAGRYADYRDSSNPAAGRDFGDSTDPKIGIFWKPVDDLGLRATYGTSFRVPALTQIDPFGGSTYFTQEPIGGQQSVVFGLAGYSEPGLGPETARTYTVGFDYAPAALKNFRVRGTYYNIDYQDRIGTAPTGGFDEFSNPQLVPDVMYRPPSAAFIEEQLRAGSNIFNQPGFDLSDPAALAAMLYARSDVWVYDRRYRNLAISRQDGFDLSVSHRFATDIGEVSWGANATHVLNAEEQGSPRAFVLPAYDIPGEAPDWRGRAFAGVTAGGFNTTLSVNYIDDYANPWVTGSPQVDSWTTVDLVMSWELEAGGPRVSLTAQNLFDRDPPLLARGSGQVINVPIGFDAVNANPLGRFVMIGVTQKW